MIRLNLPTEHDSKSFDCRRTEAWKIVRANMPFGPTIDDCGAPVRLASLFSLYIDALKLTNLTLISHYVLYTWYVVQIYLANQL